MMKILNTIRTKIITAFLTVIVFFQVSSVYAATNLSGVASEIVSNFGELAKLITAGSYIAGMGFAIGAILKFKAHKDNPTQIPIGTPIALIFIAAALIFLPTIFGVVGKTLFNSTSGVGGISGVTSFS